MNDSRIVERAHGQLQELIAILGELRNAGPRDARFKQWRQITLTLLQRIWATDPGKAAVFRRISFTAPSPLADRQTRREHFERGCREASAYLSALARGLAAVSTREAGSLSASAPQPTGSERPADAPPVAPGVAPPAGPPPGDATWPSPSGPAEPSSSPHSGESEPLPGSEQPQATSAPGPSHGTLVFKPVEPAVPWSASPTGGAPGGATSAPEPAARHGEIPPAGEPNEAGTAPRPQLRLKDMLGFGGEAPSADALAPSAPHPEAHLAPAPPPQVVGASDVAPAPHPAPQSPPLSEPSASLPGEPARSEHDLAAAFVRQSPVLQSAPRAPRHVREPGTPRLPSAAAREILSMAGMVEALGVPSRSRSIVRAALIDLGRQMESPPVHWQAIRDAVALVMDCPDLARRVLPLLLPYMDEAA